MIGLFLFLVFAALAAAEWLTRPPAHGRRNAPQIYRHPHALAAYLTRLNRENGAS